MREARWKGCFQPQSTWNSQEGHVKSNSEHGVRAPPTSSAHDFVVWIHRSQL